MQFIPTKILNDKIKNNINVNKNNKVYNYYIKNTKNEQKEKQEQTQDFNIINL